MFKSRSSDCCDDPPANEPPDELADPSEYTPPCAKETAPEGDSGDCGSAENVASGTMSPANDDCLYGILAPGVPNDCP